MYSLNNRNAVGGSLTCKSQQSWFLLGLWTGSFSKGPHLVIPMGVYVLIPSLIRAPVWAGELAKPLKARLTTAISRVVVMLDQDLA